MGRYYITTATLIVVLSTILLGCSRYAVSNEEVSYDPTTGRVTGRNVTSIVNRLPAGGKDASQGNLGIKVNETGGWSMDMVQNSETDLEGTANMTNSLLDSLIGALTNQTSAAAVAQAQAEAYRQGLSQMQQQMQQLQAQLNQLRAAPSDGTDQ